MWPSGSGTRRERPGHGAVDARARGERVGPAGVLFGPTGEVKGSELGRSGEKKKGRWAAGKGNQPRHRFVHFFPFLFYFNFRSYFQISNM
jgi:hypothetical protein